MCGCYGPVSGVAAIALIVVGALGLAGACSATAVGVTNVVAGILGGPVNLIIGILGLTGTVSIKAGAGVALGMGIAQLMVSSCVTAARVKQTT